MVLTDVGNHINLHTAGCCQRRLRQVLDQKLHCRKRKKKDYRREIKAVDQRMERERHEVNRNSTTWMEMKGHLCFELVRRIRIEDSSMIERTLSMKLYSTEPGVQNVPVLTWRRRRSEERELKVMSKGRFCCIGQSLREKQSLKNDTLVQFPFKQKHF